MKKTITILLALILFFTCGITATAHALYYWATFYPAEDANSTYAFGIENKKHIAGNNVKYYFQTTTAENYFGTATTNSFTDNWQGLITGTKVSNANLANIQIQYSSSDSPDGYAAVTYTTPLTGNIVSHYGTGTNGTNMVIYNIVHTYTTEKKAKVLAHEFGHLWGLDDLYPYNTTLSSIYSDAYAFSAATRHDRNAMRICLENYWFNPGGSQVWKYQSSPGVFTLRGDPNQDGSITTADARLVLRYAIGDETPSGLQAIVSDVDGGGISTGDSRLILRYAVGLETRFPLDLDE